MRLSRWSWRQPIGLVRHSALRAWTLTANRGLRSQAVLRGYCLLQSQYFWIEKGHRRNGLGSRAKRHWVGSIPLFDWREVDGSNCFLPISAWTRAIRTGGQVDCRLLRCRVVLKVLDPVRLCLPFYYPCQTCLWQAPQAPPQKSQSSACRLQRSQIVAFLLFRQDRAGQPKVRKRSRRCLHPTVLSSSAPSKIELIVPLNRSGPN